VEKAASGGFAPGFAHTGVPLCCLTLIARANAHNYFKEDKKDEQKIEQNRCHRTFRRDGYQRFCNEHQLRFRGSYAHYYTNCHYI
jgi:hypothetical protein